MRNNFRSFAASLVLPLFLSSAVSIKTISISLSRALRSTELFVSNHFAKSSGFGGLVFRSSGRSSVPCNPNSSNSDHISACSSVLLITPPKTMPRDLYSNQQVMLTTDGMTGELTTGVQSGTHTT